ncbi:hypothetical protein [Endozoicomonas sp. ALC013]|uniref:hypothetical protein n=1 Tax=Endozoicomonas sp. ALC013 TaxID=3403076 RepID=UPI003BB59CF3
MKNNTVEHSIITVVHDGSNALRLGMLAGETVGAKLEGNQVRHSKMIADVRYDTNKNYKFKQPAFAAILTGVASGDASLDSNSIDYCRITAEPSDKTPQKLHIGWMAAKMEGVTVSNSRLTNNWLVGKTLEVVAGGVAADAKDTTIEDTLAINNNLLVQRPGTIDPMIAVVVANADKCTISNTTAINNILKSEGARGGFFRPVSDTGIVTVHCDGSTIENTLAKGGQLSAEGRVAVAATFASNDCVIRNTTARQVNISSRYSTHTRGAVAIAAAESKFEGENIEISQTTAIDCKIFAEGRGLYAIKGYAAVGVGYLHRANVKITDTTACNSEIKGNYAGIAAGDTAYPFTRTYACNTKLTRTGGRRSRMEIPVCNKAKCSTVSSDAPTTRLTTTTTTAASVPTTVDELSSSTRLATTTTVGSAQTTDDVLSSSLETHGNSTVTLATTDSPDYRNYSPSAKTSLSTSLSSSPDSLSVNTIDNGNTSSLLNTDEVDAGIPLPALAGGVVAGILTGGVVLYTSYEWYQGYKGGLRGKELVLRPITRIKDAIFCHAPAMGYKRDSMELVSLRPIDV